jgi:hypothetical protein
MPLLHAIYRFPTTIYAYVGVRSYTRASTRASWSPCPGVLGRFDGLYDVMHVRHERRIIRHPAGSWACGWCAAPANCITASQRPARAHGQESAVAFVGWTAPRMVLSTARSAASVAAGSGVAVGTGVSSAPCDYCTAPLPLPLLWLPALASALTTFSLRGRCWEWGQDLLRRPVDGSMVRLRIRLRVPESSR